MPTTGVARRQKLWGGGTKLKVLGTEVPSGVQGRSSGVGLGAKPQKSKSATKISH